MSWGIKQFLPRSLLGRSLLILVVPVVVVQIVTTIVFFDRHWDRVTQRFSDALAGEMVLIAENIELASHDQDSIDVIIGDAIRHLDLYIQYDAGATLSGHSSDYNADPGWESLVADIFVPILRKQLKRPFYLDLKFDEKWVALDVQLKDGVMHVGFPQRRLFSSSGYIYLLWVFGSAFLLLLIAVIFMRNQVRPIRKLAAAAERFGRGRDVQFFKPEGAREVRQAGESFLSMYRRIRRQVEQRTLMLAGVSHDLRTPLTRLKLQLSMMPDSADTQHMMQDIQDMERMIAGYLDFVRGEGDEQEAEVDFAAFLKTVVGAYQRQDVSVDLEVDLDIMVALRPVAMERCLNNILGNALEYGQTVRVRAFLDDDQRLHIVIEDDGPGIPPEEYEDVFKPFYRVDNARSKPHGSVGLGLSIAMDIVHLHGGRIWLAQSDLGGLAVHIRLPV